MNYMRSDIKKWRVSFTPIIILVGLLFIVFTKNTNASIQIPYIVEERERATGSDSVEIVLGDKTYFGLENYLYEYVNNYLRITFTYTHLRCCYDSFPPKIYITDVDPRNTSTPNVRSSLVTYNISGYEPTDVYFYDIQFKEDGYRVIVKNSTEVEVYNEYFVVSGLEQTDWVALANTHQYIPESPSLNSFSFTPRPIKINGPTSPTRNPVIIVPGIMGSYLNKEDGEEVWMNLRDMILSPSDSYLDDLRLTTTGESVVTITPSSIIKNTLKDDFFNKLI